MKFKSCMLISAIYTSLISTLIEIYGVYILPTDSNDYLTAQSYLEANLFTSPIKNITTIPSSSNCTKSSLHLSLWEWEGLYSGCSCEINQGQSPDFIYSSTECFGIKGCNQIYSTGSRNVVTWKNQSFCADFYSEEDGFEFKKTSLSNCSSSLLVDCGLACVFANSSCPISSVELVVSESEEQKFSVKPKRSVNASDDILVSMAISYDPSPCISPSLSQLRPASGYFALEKHPQGCESIGPDQIFSKKVDSLQESEFWNLLLHPPVTSGFELFLEFTENLTNSIGLFTRSRIKLKSTSECSNQSIVPGTSLIENIETVRNYLKFSLWCGIFLLVFAIGSSDSAIRSNNSLSCFNYAGSLFFIAAFFRVSKLFAILLVISNSNGGFFGIAFHNCFADDSYNGMIQELVGFYISYFGGFLSLDLINVFCGFTFLFVSFNILVTKIQMRHNVYEEVQKYFESFRQNNSQGRPQEPEEMALNMANFEEQEENQ